MITYIIISSIISLSLQGDFLLEYKKVGSLEVGSSAEEVYYVYDKDEETELVDRYLEATFSPAIMVKKNGIVLFFANLDCDKIYSFEVSSHKYSTKNGMRVGMTFKALREKHEVSTILSGEGRLFAVVNDLDMSFALETTELLDRRIDIYSSLNPEDIPDDITVSSILVY